MIFYNGRSLESVADVKIEDVRVSPIQYSPVTRPRAIQAGSQFVRNRKGTRTVTITFALLDDNEETRQGAILAISEWAKTDKEYRLEVPNFPQFYLMAVCTSKPEPSLRVWWESKLRLVFTCFSDPFLISRSEKSVACGTQFAVLGDGVPMMRIERTLGSQASNQSYSNGDQTMTFSTVPAGNLVIDLNEQSAFVGSTDIMQYYNPTGAFIIPKTGLQTITGTGTVKFRERWE